MNLPEGFSPQPAVPLSGDDQSCSVEPDFQRLVRVEEHDLDRWGEAIPAMYARWMEETEYGFLRSRQLSVSLTDERGRYGFPRTRVELEVTSAARRGDQLKVLLWLGKTDGKRLNYRFQIDRRALERQGETNLEQWELCANGRFVMACCRFPAEAMPYAIPIPERVLMQLGLSPE